MPKIQGQIEIDAAAADVFRFAHDAASRSKWDMRVVNMELLTPAPVRSGTLFRVDAGSGGYVSFSWEGEITAFHFPHSSTFRVMDAAPSSPFVRGSTESWEFSSTGGGTRVTISRDYKTRGFIGKVTDALGGRATAKRAIRRSLANLKRLMEKH
jgi:uncharacterized protein YndB with AHSA1/START domain